MLFLHDACCLLDFEDTALSWLPFHVEIAFILERFVFAQEIDADWKKNACALFLNGYERAAQHSIALTPAVFCSSLELLKYIALSRLVQAYTTYRLVVPGSEWEKFFFLWEQKEKYTQLLAESMSCADANEN